MLPAYQEQLKSKYETSPADSQANARREKARLLLWALTEEELNKVAFHYRDPLLVYLSHYVDLCEWSPERLGDGSVTLSNGEERYSISEDEATWTFISGDEVDAVTFIDLFYRFATCKFWDETTECDKARGLVIELIISAVCGVDLTSGEIRDLGQFFQAPDVIYLKDHYGRAVRNDDAEWAKFEALIGVARAPSATVPERPTTTNLASIPQGFPTHCLNVPGLVGDIADWINRSAIMPQPVFALMNSIAAVGTIAGRRYAFEGEDTRTNVYLLAIGKTGVGKDHSRKQVKKLLSAAGLPKLLMGDDVHSRSGLLSALQSHPVKLCHMDEFGKKLEAMASKSDTTAKSITKGLLELTGAANGILLGDEYADNKAKPRVDLHEPHLSLFATTTPETLTAALSSADTVSGLLNRFILGETSNSLPDRRSPSEMNPPSALIEAVRASYAVKPEGIGNLQGVVVSDGMINPAKIPVGATAEGLDLIERAYDEQRAHLRQDSPTAPLWARYRELVIKFAMIRAIGIEPAEPIISEADARWACDLVRASTTYASELISRHVSDNETERFSKKLFEIIRKAGPEGVTKSRIIARTRTVTRRVRDEALADLQDAGFVSSELRSTATKSAYVYWARQG